MTSTSKAKARALHGPGLFEIIFGALLSLGLGVTLGVVCLVVRPVEKVKELPKEPVGPAIYQPVYFVPGSADSGKSRNVAFERKALTEAQPGTTVVLTEDDLNALVESIAPPPPPPPPPAATPGAKPKPPTPPPAAAAAPGKPAEPAPEIAQLPPGPAHFRIHDGTLQAALPGDFNALGVDFSLIMQLRGGFVHGADGFAFQPGVFYLGSLPLHRLPGVSAWAYKRMLSTAQQKVPEDLKAAWGKLSSVSIEDNTLKLSMP
jgi:hypothetical protein